MKEKREGRKRRREKRNVEKGGEINGDEIGLREGKTLRREGTPM